MKACHQTVSTRRLWSLWDMLKLEVGRLLELHERLTVEKGNAEQSWQELHKAGSGHTRFPAHEYVRLRDSVRAVQQIAAEAGLKSTEKAAARTVAALSRLPLDGSDGSFALMDGNSHGALFRHLSDVVSRIRDDCEGSIYFQIDEENAALLRPQHPHFGTDVEKAFKGAEEDIAEAAACIALERFTASAFHVMRALELAVQVIANKLGATIADQHGKTLPWGVIAQNMKPLIDKMLPGAEKVQWYRVHALLETFNRAWRAPTAHPKQTYTPAEARRVFDATRDFMQELAPLA